MTMLVVIALGVAIPAGLRLQIGFATNVPGVTRIWGGMPIGFVAVLITVVPLATLGLGLATAAPDRLLRPFS